MTVLRTVFYDQGEVSTFFPESLVSQMQKTRYLGNACCAGPTACTCNNLTYGTVEEQIH